MLSKRQAARTDLRQNDLELSVDRATRRPVAAAHATPVSFFRRAEILITAHALQDRVLTLCMPMLHVRVSFYDVIQFLLMYVF